MMGLLHTGQATVCSHLQAKSLKVKVNEITPKSWEESGPQG